MSKYKNIKLRSEYTKAELDQLGVDLLEWMDEKPEENWHLKDFLNTKDIPFDYIERFRKLSAKFADCWDLATQRMESYLVHQIIEKKGSNTGLLEILRNECSWQKEATTTQELEVQREELEAILKKKFPKRELFQTKKQKVAKVSEEEHK